METPEVQPEVAVVEEVKEPGLDPYKLLAEMQGPSKGQIDIWKQSACNGRVRIFSPDTSFKRLFVLRGLSAREWDLAQAEVPVNTPPEKLEQILQVCIVAKAVLWSSMTKGQIGADTLSNSGAGLTLALYEIVAQLSDFVPPQAIERLSAEL